MRLCRLKYAELCIIHKTNKKSSILMVKLKYLFCFQEEEFYGTVCWNVISLMFNHDKTIHCNKKIYTFEGNSCIVSF